MTSWEPPIDSLDYTPLHFPVPVLRLLLRGPEDLHVPLPPAPGLDDVADDYVDEDLGEGAALGIPLEVIGLLVPPERRIEQHRQEQVEPVVHDDDLPAGALLGGVIDEVFLGAVGPDVALEDELLRDDLLDGDLLVPAVA